MLGALGWQDKGCFQCTSKSLPCRVECQGSLANKWWGHDVHHIGVNGICYRQLTWCLHDPGQWAGQWAGSWADPVWVEMFEHTEGQHITSSSSINLDTEWGCSLTAGTCRQFYHCVCFIAPWAWTSSTTLSSGRVSPMVPQLTASTNSSSHGGVSSVLTCIMLAFFPFPWHWWWEAFSVPLDLVDCWPTAPELWHSKCPVTLFGIAFADGIPCWAVVTAREMWTGAVGALWGTILWLVLLSLMALLEGMDGFTGTYSSQSWLNNIICASDLQ